MGGKQPADGDENEVVARAQLRRKGQVTLPQEIREALNLSEGDEVEFTVHADGEVTLRAMTGIPKDQQWFWTEEWQAGEREASAELAAGLGTFHEDVDAMFADLNG
jgi:antitoxin PrlF